MLRPHAGTTPTPNAFPPTQGCPVPLSPIPRGFCPALQPPLDAEWVPFPATPLQGIVSPWSRMLSALPQQQGTVVPG